MPLTRRVIKKFMMSRQLFAPPSQNIKIRLDNPRLAQLKLAAFDRVASRAGIKTIIGVDENQLFFLLDGFSYSIHCQLIREESTTRDLDISKILDDDFVHPLLIRCARIEFRKCIDDFLASYLSLHFNSFRLKQSIQDRDSLLKLVREASKNDFSELTNEQLFDCAQVLQNDPAKYLCPQLYRKMKIDHSPPYYLARLYLLKDIDSELADEHFEQYIRLKNHLACALINEIPSNLDAVTTFLLDDEITLASKRLIADALWQKRSQLPITHLITIIKALLSQGYCGEKGNASFLIELEAMIAPLSVEAQEELKQKVADYQSDPLSTANRFLDQKRHEEALFWYYHALELNFLDIPCLEKCAQINSRLSPAAQKILNQIRIFLFSYFISTSNVLSARKYYPLIQSEDFSEAELNEFKQIEDSYFRAAFSNLYLVIQQTIDQLWQQALSLDNLEEHYDAWQLATDLQKILDVTPKIKKTDSIDVVKTQFTMLEKLLAQKLSDRWAIVNKYYLHPSIFNLTQNCLQLAQQISEQPYRILMPSLDSEVDGYGQSINELQLSQFILTEDRKNFIALAPLFTNAISRARKGENEKDLFTYLLPNAEEKPLTPFEWQEITTLFPLAEDFKAAAIAYLAAAADTALGVFNTLRLGLLKGDRDNSGQERDAGADANSVIVDFIGWLERLPPEQKIILEDLDNFNYILHTLIKSEEVAKHRDSNENLHVRYCVQSIARSIERFIADNTAILESILAGKGGLRNEQDWMDMTTHLLKRIESTQVEVIAPPGKEPYECPGKVTPLWEIISLCAFVNNQITALKENFPHLSLANFHNQLTEGQSLWKAYPHLSPEDFNERWLQFQKKVLFLLLDSQQNPILLPAYRNMPLIDDLDKHKNILLEFFKILSFIATEKQGLDHRIAQQPMLENLPTKEYPQLLESLISLGESYPLVPLVTVETKLLQVKSQLGLLMLGSSQMDRESLANYIKAFPPLPQTKQLLEGISKHKFGCKEPEKLKTLLSNASLGTLGFHLKNNTINVILAPAAPGQPVIEEKIYYEQSADESKSFFIEVATQRRYFQTIDQALDTLKIERTLLVAYPQLRELFNSLDQAINNDKNPPLFQKSLYDLKSKLTTETFYQLRTGKKPDDIQQGMIGNTIREISQLVTALTSDGNTRDKKLVDITNCKEKLMPTPAGKTFGKVLLAVFITAAVTFLGIALGTAAGIIAGAPTGPGIGASGATGAWLGAKAGWTIGTTGAAILTGVTLSTTSLVGFFKKTPCERMIDHCLSVATLTINP